MPSQASRQAPGEARQRKEIGAAGDPGRRPALDRRGADLLIAEPAEQLAEAGNLLLIDAVKASGVTSRPVTPMPPVEITTPISGSLIHARSCEAGWEGQDAPGFAFALRRAQQGGGM